MFKFERQQLIFEVGGTKIGGQPGELPTVMIGSMFYKNDKIVKNEAEGIFDKDKARQLLLVEEELSRATGNPRILDIVGTTPKAMEKYIDFIADFSNQPFSIDGVSAEARIAGVKHAEQQGLINRTIYNSITYATTEEERVAIRDTGIRTAIVLAFNPQKPILEGRMDIIKGLNGQKGVLAMAKEAGIEQPLVDSAILDMSDPGPASKFIYQIKNDFGLPAGCGAHNAIALFSNQKRLDSKTKLIVNSAANTIPIVMGANFALYGPVKKAAELYPSIAFVDACIAYSMRQEFKIKPLTKDHPIFKIFR